MKDIIDLPDNFTLARTELILDHCFFGSLLLRLTPKVDNECESIWVDGKTIGLNMGYCESQDTNKLIGVLAKAVIHCILGHTVRRNGRQKDTWNDSCSFAANLIVHKSGLELPDGILLDHEFDNMSVEEIYDVLFEKKQEKKDEYNDGSGNGLDSGNSGNDSGESDASNDPNAEDSGEPSSESVDSYNGDGNSPESKPYPEPEPCSGQDANVAGEVRDTPKDNGEEGPLSEAEQTEMENEWKMVTQQAIQNGEMQGTNPGEFKEEIEHSVLEPKISWKEELMKYFQFVKRTDLSWSRPNRKFISSGLYLPGAHSIEMGEVVVAIDTSGSISQSDLAMFEEEINYLLEQVKPEKAHVILCDAAVRSVEEYTADDLPIKLEVVGRGGTDFRPVFNLIDTQFETIPACVVYLTDLAGKFPDKEPEYPVLWVRTSHRKLKAPFGDTVPFNSHV